MRSSFVVFCSRHAFNPEATKGRRRVFRRYAMKVPWHITKTNLFFFFFFFFSSFISFWTQRKQQTQKWTILPQESPLRYNSGQNWTHRRNHKTNMHGVLTSGTNSNHNDRIRNKVEPVDQWVEDSPKDTEPVTTVICTRFLKWSLTHIYIYIYIYIPPAEEVCALKLMRRVRTKLIPLQDIECSSFNSFPAY